MRILLLFLSLYLASCGSPRWEKPEAAVKVEESWDSGSLKARYYLASSAADAQRIGPFVQWYESGVVQEQGFYQAGKKHNWWDYFDANGRKEKKVLFDMGEPKRTVIPSPYEPHYYHPHRHHPFYDPFCHPYHRHW